MLIGLAGLILPFLPGWLLIIPGLAILGLPFNKIVHKLEKRYPRLRPWTTMAQQQSQKLEPWTNPLRRWWERVAYGKKAPPDQPPAPLQTKPQPPTAG